MNLSKSCSRIFIPAIKATLNKKPNLSTNIKERKEMKIKYEA
ncbi:MAG: hypothetical protein Q8872_02970 [Candidatus Phytoplasma australasiaticum]|nr:hypothetical protein [Candidatus Phytoplasma australasiaticum]